MIQFVRVYDAAWRMGARSEGGSAMQTYTRSPPTLAKVSADMATAKVGRGDAISPHRVPVLMHMMGCRWVEWVGTMALSFIKDDKICAPCVCESPYVCPYVCITRKEPNPMPRMPALCVQTNTPPPY